MAAVTLAVGTGSAGFGVGAALGAAAAGAGVTDILGCQKRTKLYYCLVNGINLDSYLSYALLILNFMQMRRMEIEFIFEFV